jgi:hypothetical protein
MADQHDDIEQDLLPAFDDEEALIDDREPDLGFDDPSGLGLEEERRRGRGPAGEELFEEAYEDDY